MTKLEVLLTDASRALVISDNLMNIGDLVLCVQAIELLRAANAGTTIHVWQWQKPSASVREALASLSTPVELEYGKSLRSALSKPDLLLFAGGQLVRASGSLACLAGLLTKIVWAKRRGAKVAAVAIGVGPVHRIRRLAWRILLGKLDYVSVRDAESLRHWRNIMGGMADERLPQLTQDLAFRLSKTMFGVTEAPLSRRIVIAPCYCDEEQRGVAFPVLARAISEVSLATSARHLVFAAHDSRADKDRSMCSELAAHFAARSFTTEVLACSDVNAYGAAYGAAQAIITNRLHGIVFGLLAGRPVFVLDDGCEKIRAAAEQFALPLVTAFGRGSDAKCVGDVERVDVVRALQQADKALKKA